MVLVGHLNFLRNASFSVLLMDQNKNASGKIDYKLYPSNFLILSYNGETSTNLPDSNYWHQRTSLANIENKVLAVGSSGPENNNRAEVLDIQANIWTNRARYPFCSSR